MRNVLCAVVVLLWLGSTAHPQDSSPVSRPEPDPNQILDAMRAYVQHYIENLPNFICLQTVEQFQTGRKRERWSQRSTTVYKLIFDGQHEKRNVELVNGHPPKSRSQNAGRGSLGTEGEFATLLANVFKLDSNTHFEWKGWTDFGGHHLAIYNYSIEQAHSTLKLSLNYSAQAILPYHGSVYADPLSGAVWHISDEANEIPPEIKTRSIATSIDYKPVRLGDSVYLLPDQASVQVATDAGYMKNELRFQNYQKFAAQSTITFQSDGSDDSSPKPKSEPSEKPPLEKR